MTQQQDTTLKDTVQTFLINDKNFLVNVLQAAMQKILDIQFIEHMNVAPYERSEERQDYRNGSYYRTLATRAGKIVLKISRDRRGRFKTSLFEKYTRHEKAFILGIAEMYLQGVSTRNVESILEELCGLSISKSKVSTLAQSLDTELEKWRIRPLEDIYEYLIIDARYDKVRIDGRVVSQASLIAIGITVNGDREIVACQVADSEKMENWNEFFKALKNRGLKNLKMIISDDHTGLRGSLDKHFQGISWQRCQVHFMRNFLGKLNKSDQAECMTLLRDIYTAHNREEAQEKIKIITSHLRVRKKIQIADWLEENIQETLEVLNLPMSHRKKLKSTNMLERFNQEIKRRTKVIRIFPNRNALLRLLTAMCQEESESWSYKKYL